MDLKAAPWHTTAEDTNMRLLLDERDRELAAAKEELQQLRANLDWAEHCRAQAEERLEDEKAATAAAEEQTFRESNRADGAEGHLHDVIVEFVVEPATGVLRGVSDGVDANDIPDEVIVSTAETLADNLKAGLAAGDLAALARELLTDWAEESR